MSARRLASLALTVAGAFFLFWGGLTLYLRQEAFDSDAFADRASTALENEDVRAVVSTKIVDGLVNAGASDLLQAKPLLETVVEGALDTGAFRSVFRQAVVQTHRLLFVRDQESIVLDLANAGVVAVSAIKAVAPGVAKQIPRDVEPGLIQLSERSWTTDLLQTADSVRHLGVVLPILALLCFVGAVALAFDRRDALVWVGGALAVDGAAVVIILILGRALLVSKLGGDDEQLRGAIGATWDAFLGSLRAWALAVAGGGVILAAAASAVIEREDVTTVGERARRLLFRTPATRWGRLARAGVVLLVSLLVVLQPTYALQVVAVVVGGYGLFFASTEVLQVISPRAAGPSPLRRIRLRALTPREAFGALGAVVAVLGVIAIVRAVSGDGEPPLGDPNPRYCNGFRELCNRPLNEVAFSAAHNAMSASDQRGWFIANHQKAVADQLDFGIRGFLIDAHYGIRNNKGQVRTDLDAEKRNKAAVAREQLGPEAIKASERLISGRLGAGELKGERGTYLCHTLCEIGNIGMAEWLKTVNVFLDRHPDEVLVLFIEDYIEPRDAVRAFREAGLTRFVYTHDRDAPWPTLRELIQQGKRVFVMVENDESGDPPWYHNGFELTQETPYKFTSVAELEAGEETCARNRGSTNSPLFQLNHFLEKIPLSPRKAETANSYDVLFSRAKLCAGERDLQPNLVAVDFFDRGDVLRVVNVLNGLPADAKMTVPTRKG